MASSTNNYVQMPVDLLAFLMGDPEIHTRLFEKPQFRKWMLEQPELVRTLVGNTMIAKYIQELEDEFWSQCLKSLRNSSQTCQVQLDSSSCSSLPSPSLSSPSSPDVQILTESSNANANTKIGSINTTGSLQVNVTTKSHGHSLNQLDKVTINEQAERCKDRPALVLSSQSTRGDAKNEVDSIVLGDIVKEVHHSYTYVNEGVAVVNSHVGKGITVDTKAKNVEPNFWSRRETKPSTRKGNVSVKCDAVPLPKDSDDPEQFQEMAKSKPNQPDELEEEVHRLTTGIGKNMSWVSAAVSTKGDAVLNAKKVTIDMQDSEKGAMAYCKSEEKNAIMNIGELSITSSKPRPECMNLNINKVVGSIYHQNQFSTNITDSKDVNLLGTSVGNARTEKELKKSSKKKDKT